MANHSHDASPVEPASERLGRRKVLFGGFLAMLAGVYGFFAVLAAMFVFPRRKQARQVRIFLGFSDELNIGQSRVVTMPSGDQLLLSNTGTLRPENGSTFSAFSNRCPHLGCKVHWSTADSRFECPCHQGIFDPDGIATSGPPEQAGQSLRSYPLELDGDSIYAVVEEV